MNKKGDDNNNRQWLNIPARDNQARQIEDRDNSEKPEAPHQEQPQPDNDSHKGEAAANVARSQVEHIYNTNPPHEEESRSSVPQTYDRHTEAGTIDYDWHAYHTAWQDYYQKYYQRYYLQQLHEQRQKILLSRANDAAAAAPDNPQQEQAQTKQQSSQPDEIHDEILNTISSQARRFRKSSHFVPLISAIVIGALFLLLNYNKLISAQVHAYVSPSSTVSDNIIVDPNASVPVGKEPRLIIPKINVDAPLVYGLKSLDNNTTQKALEDGVVHYPIPGASSLPGQTGNSVFLGHSSHTVFNRGSYNFVFVLLPRMEKGDLFYIHHEGKRYVYRVTKKQVIKPSQVGELIVDSSKPMATLVTCVPIGTNKKRLLLFAEQISPDPAKAEKVTSSDKGAKDVKIPGNQPTILEQLFGN